MPDVLSLWNKCLNELRYQVKDNVFTMWLRPLVADLNNGILEVKAPNEYFVNEVRKHYLEMITDVVIKHSQGEITQVVVQVAHANGVAEQIQMGLSTESLTNELGNRSLDNRSLASNSSDGFSSHTLDTNSHTLDTNNFVRQSLSMMSGTDTPNFVHENKVDDKSLSYLNPDFTFDTFVTGKSNNLAYKACYELGKRNSKNKHNPLFIYGASGLGKTHLMHSIAHRYVKSNRTFYYFTSDKFINQMVYALRMNKIEDFKKKVQKVDLLIIDDIHVLAGKTKTSAEFLSLFADFTSGDKQLILASDRHPAQLTEFDERFRSRLSGGLSVAVEPPELDTRVQILQKKSTLIGITLPKECALFIAQNVVSNVRRLEGALNQVVANTNLTGAPISLEMVQYALKDVVAMRVQAVNMDNIRKVVAEYYSVSVKDLMGKKRTRHIARPRQIAMSLSRELTKDSFPDIGQSFGGRDHSTVMHACKKVEELRQQDPVLDKEYKALSMMLQAG